MLEELLDDEVLDEERDDELEELDELLDDELDPLDDELVELDELDDPEPLDELEVLEVLDDEPDDVLDVLLDDELLDDAPPPALGELLLDVDDVLDPPPATPPPLMPPASSGEVGVVVQAALNPAASAAAGAPASSSRKLRRSARSSGSPARGLRGGKNGLTDTSRQGLQGAAPVIQLDPPDDLVGGDHVHAARQRADDVDAQGVGAIVHVAVAEGQRARLPAAAVVAAAQRTHGVDELMVRIGGEVGRLAAAGDDHAGPVQRHAGFHLDRGGEVHQEAHRRQRALGVVHQPDELAVRGAPAQIVQ